MTPTGEWAPVTETADDVVAAGAAAALHGLLDAPGGPPAPGAPIPPLWHWLAFLPCTPQRELGADGHPRTGGFLPPMGEGRRRMWAAGALTFGPPVPVGAALRRTSAVSGVEEKEGRSGRLVFVTVTHELRGGGGTITERQDIVYRGAEGSPPAPAAPAADPDASQEWTWEHALEPDPTLLFRFSALTYNAHRIHYDHPYATAVEGYPGLVVHGPLQAVALAELCRRHLPERPLAGFRFRSVRPAFLVTDLAAGAAAGAAAVGEPLRCCGRRTASDEVELVALDHHGQVTMRATAELAGR